jgi:hypothetical protein
MCRDLRCAGLILALCLGARDALADEGRFGLGLGIKEVDGILLVARVLPGSAAHDAGFVLGEQVVALDGSRLSSLRDLETRLEKHSGGDRLSLDHAPIPATNRIGAMAIGCAITGQTNTESAWLGAYCAHAINPTVSWVLAGGYSAVGARPGDGRNVIVAAVGLETALPIVGDLFGFARGLVGVDLPDGEGVNPGFWPLEPVNLTTHLGARFRFLEAFLSAGLGPAKGANVGMGVALVVGFGGPSVDDPGEFELL